MQQCSSGRLQAAAGCAAAAACSSICREQTPDTMREDADKMPSHQIVGEYKEHVGGGSTATTHGCWRDDNGNCRRYCCCCHIVAPPGRPARARRAHMHP
eukprot:COSAG01_NODE_2835_length_6985_cov_407.845083_6_plen_99_part_00